MFRCGGHPLWARVDSSKSEPHCHNPAARYLLSDLLSSVDGIEASEYGDLQLGFTGRWPVGLLKRTRLHLCCLFWDRRGNEDYSIFLSRLVPGETTISPYS